MCESPYIYVLQTVLQFKVKKMVTLHDDLRDCKICDIVDELCSEEAGSKCELIKAYLDKDPTPRQFILKSVEVFGEKKTKEIMDKLADDMGV